MNGLVLIFEKHSRGQMKLHKIFYVGLVFMLTSLALAKPKPYQQILIGEPVSLLDLAVFKAQLKADIFLEKQLKGKPINEFLFGRQLKMDWIVEPKKSRSLYLPITYEFIAADFDFKEGFFEYALRVSWDLTNISVLTDIPSDAGQIKHSQANMASVCKYLLKKIKVLKFKVADHSGYTNKHTRNLPSFEKLLIKSRKDTRYIVQIDAGFLESDLYLRCESLSPSRHKKVNFKFEGKWHELDNWVKELNGYLK